MASMSKSEGRWNIRFVGPDKRRRWLRLGEVSKRDAETVKGHVEAIISAMIVGSPSADDTQRWLAKLGDAMHEKLAAAGLTAARGQATLAAFIDSYIDSRRDAMKPATLLVWGHVRRNLIDRFGANKALRDITAGDADQWRLWLASNEKLSENTIRKRCQFAKMFFRAAVRHKLIQENPLADIKGKVQANPTRSYFVTRDEIAKVLKACPDSQWRMIVALSRDGGLRCPSEHLALTWGDIDLETNRITVRSPKTEHHAGGEFRIVPIFPELRPYLEAGRNELLESDFDPKQRRLSQQPVITRYRDHSQNLGTQFRRIILRAGLTPWPKAFHNLRATRETELAEEFPLHVVCKWIGNSQAIAARHYLQVTDDHFAKAAGGGVVQSMGQNPGHTAPELYGNTLKRTEARNEKTPVFQGFSSDCSSVQTSIVEDRGLEPLTSCMPCKRSPN